MKNSCVGRRMFYYNTVCEIILYEYMGNGAEILDGCENVMRAVQKRLNIYDPDSELSHLNHDYTANIPYRVSHELYAILREMMLFSELSAGSYDPTVGPLIRLWNFTSESPKIPGEQEIAETMERCGYKKLRLCDEKETVTFYAEGMEIDAGGAGKGYAAELAADFLRASGVTSASINFGGNLYLLGGYQEEKGALRPWKIGVQKPWEKKGEILGTLLLQDRGVATSAGYERYFEQSGDIYHHILDPASGRPVQTDLVSVTVVSDSALVTDLMSTAFFVLGLKEGERAAEKMRKSFYLEYIAVTKKEISLSDGIRDHFQKKTARM